MSATSTRKTRSSARGKRVTPKSRVREVSWLDKFLRAMPFSQEEVQRGLTWGILAIALAAVLLIAAWFGVPQMAYRQFGQMTAKAGFEVKNIETTGMRRVDQLKVYEIVLSEMEKPMLLVDIEQIRAQLNSYGWIKDVRVTRRLPSTLVVAVDERVPTAVWQRGEKFALLDDEGKILADIPQSEIGTLPVIGGENANMQIAALTDLVGSCAIAKRADCRCKLGGKPQVGFAFPVRRNFGTARRRGFGGAGIGQFYANGRHSPVAGPRHYPF